MMLLRQFAPALALSLAALVVVQALDLVPCADEAEAASSDGGFHVDGMGGPGAHPTPVPGAGHDEGAPHEESPGLADCLCHVSFTRTERLPDVAGAPAAPPLPYVAYLERMASVAVKPLDHVPLA
jgi:hypothetical protein